MCLRFDTKRLLCTCLALALCTLAQGRESDRQKPMDVESDHSQTSTAANGATHLWGNVHATQGTLEMKADDAMLTQNKDGLARVVLKGKPVHLKQDDENGDPMTSTSQNLDYDLVKKIAVLTGNVIITQPRGVMRGERVVYDVGNSQITSGGDGTRVRMHIEPKQASATPQTEQEKKDKKAKKAAKKAAAAAASDGSSMKPPTSPPAKTDTTAPAKTDTPPPAKSGGGTP